jgi:hypothetical protein
MGSRRIRVSSHALDEPVTVNVMVYDTREEMAAAAHRYNGCSDEGGDTLAVTQATTAASTGWTLSVIVRFTRGRLNTQIVVHEMHHAATALYGNALPEVVRMREHFNHFNEPFAHLHSDLTARLVARLYALGYYDKAVA